MHDGEHLLTTGEVAALLRVSPVTVGRWVKDGKLDAVRLPGGNTLRFRQADIDALLAPTDDVVPAGSVAS